MVENVVLLQTTAVSVLIVLTCVVCDVDPFRLSRAELRARTVDISPYVALLVAFYLVNRSSHTVGRSVSTLIGTNITDSLYALEGDVVAHLQGSVPTDFAGYFTVVYLVGFVFILVFPVVAYFVLPSRRYLTELFLAYAVNYGVGAACYVLFIAYGPRYAIDRVGAPMYELYPQLADLTGEVNSAANVFPSLHVSLTTTVVLLAWRTRAAYPRWLWLASLIAVNIVFSTMYLGIHWLTDVIAGFALAILSVAVASRVVGRTDAAVSTPDRDVAD